MKKESVDPCSNCMGDKEWGPNKDKCVQCLLLEDWWDTIPCTCKPGTRCRVSCLIEVEEEK